LISLAEQRHLHRLLRLERQSSALFARRLDRRQ
jgi:hypothetical protein